MKQGVATGRQGHSNRLFRSVGLGASASPERRGRFRKSPWAVDCVEELHDYGQEDLEEAVMQIHGHLVQGANVGIVGKQEVKQRLGGRTARTP